MVHPSPPVAQESAVNVHSITVDKDTKALLSSLKLSWADEVRVADPRRQERRGGHGAGEHREHRERRTA
jgi:hypothetical protein